MPISLRPYQLEIKKKIFKAWDAGHKNVMLQLPTGMGKCLGRDTPVLLYNGTMKMSQEVKKFDRLMGPDSKPRTVLSTCKGRSELFRIDPVKGESWVCNDVHILTLKHTQTKEILDISLPEYFGTSKNFKHLHKQFRVGVDFRVNPTTCDPYMLGLFLAEGTHGRPQLTNPDKEVISYCKDWAKKSDMKITLSPGRGCLSIRFSDFEQGWGKNKMKNLADYCTNRDDRWIPREFLINDRKTRFNLLAGLLDGDGYMHHGGFEIITKYPSLNRDVLFLARSLGFAAYSNTKIARIRSTGFVGKYHRIFISGDTHLIPTKIKRKKATSRKQIKDVLNTGFKVTPIGHGEYFGFELNGDGRFLLGDFTVTHNTATFVQVAIDMALDAKGPRHPTAIMVHRKELVQQISLTLAEEGVVHNIITPRPVIMGIVAAHRKMYNKQFYDYNSPITVVSVDTLNSRIIKHMAWAKSIKFWITDEAAHLLKKNKWGRAVEYFPNAFGLGVTATPHRLDKRGLGSHADGVFDHMIQGPSSRWGIENGFLCNYKIAIPKSDYQNFLKKAGEGADYTREAQRFASQSSHIIGDVVENYLKHAKGKQGILFASDIKTAEEMEEKFIEAGVKTKLLTGLTEDKERLDSLIDYRNKKIQMLLNVDLFDEGLDVPGIECVVMARPTMSLGKYLQMIGRGMRPSKDKPFLIIIDHVGNVERHGLPDKSRKWTLDRIVKRRDKTNMIRICTNPDCNAPFDRILTACPYCGTEVPKPKAGGGGSRPSPEQVDGDLELLDPETLRAMYESAVLESPADIRERVGAVAGGPAGIRAMRNQTERIETQQTLVDIIALWAGKQRKEGYTDRQIHKKFYLEFDLTITEALAEPKAKMLETIAELRSQND